MAVKSEADLKRTVRPEEEIAVLLLAKDEDENLSHLVLRDKRGNEIVRMNCDKLQLGECSALLKITASGNAKKTIEFGAVAVDHLQEESAPIFMAITTERTRAGGGGGGGGGGSSSSQPTPVPLPNVNLGNGQATLGGIVELALTIDKVPDGLSGYKVKVSVADPTVGIISAVVFPPEFERFNRVLLFPPFSEVQIIAIFISQVDSSEQVVLARITFDGLKQGETAIVVSVDTTFGIQDKNATIMSVTTTNGELTVP